MNNYSCIIIDDEPKAIELLIEILKYLYSNIEILGTYTSWTKALDALRNTECDILFTDISMPGKSGMDILNMVPNIKSEIIFITAHSDYALSAFKFAAAGYVLKPIDDIELTKAVDKAIERIQYKRLAKQNTTNNANALSLSPKIGIPYNKGIDYVNINDIIYFETMNKYTKVVGKDFEILSSYNIGRFKSMLENQMFYQVHRSYIVNLNCIRRYETTGTIIMTNDKEIPIAKGVREEFLKLFGRVTRIAGNYKDDAEA